MGATSKGKAKRRRWASPDKSNHAYIDKRGNLYVTVHSYRLQRRASPMQFVFRKCG